jgi:hypothetical protein
MMPSRSTSLSRSACPSNQVRPSNYELVLWVLLELVRESLLYVRFGKLIASTDLTITIKSSHPASMNGSSPTPPSLIFTATNLEILRDLLARCKRLKDASSSYPAAGLGMNSFGGTPLAEGQTWPWLQPYLHFHHPSSSADIPLGTCPDPLVGSLVDHDMLAYSLPADLRLLHPSPTTASPLTTKSLTPSSALYSHLSPSHAASTSDSMGDIDAIRDAWVRSQVVSLSTPTNSDHTEKSTLNIHVGTFNVNGKLPAEGTNLDSWLGIGHTSRDRLVLPPVPAVSPLEVPLLSSGGDQESGTEGSLEFKLRGVSSTLETSPLDIIVLAFQELDLSTAALIYATEKSREEAWTQVVLRSLNNHSWKEQPAYTKVSLLIHHLSTRGKHGHCRSHPSSLLACFSWCLSGHR